MKLAFSSMGCPDWDLDTMIAQAAQMGYEGIEFRGLQGQMHLPAVAALAQSPGRVADRMEEAGLRVACLGTGASFHWQDRKKVAENKAQVREFIELAAGLRCPFVRVFGDEVPRYEVRETTMLRIAEALADLGPVAASYGVTVVLENHGDFCSSRDMWFILDAAQHPSVRCCWHPCHGRTAGDRHTLAVPRVGAKLGLTHVVDGRFADETTLEGYAVPGEGDLDLPLYMRLLKGLAYDGWVVFDWPKLWIPSLADPDKAFPAALAKLKGMIKAVEDEKELTAYKGDKNVPRYAARQSC